MSAAASTNRPSRIQSLCHRPALLAPLAGLALLACDRGGDHAMLGPRIAEAAAPASPSSDSNKDGTNVTPKTAVPNEARVLSDAFANVAAAIRPSVVRIDVETSGGGPRLAGRERSRPGPDLDVPRFFERFFEFGDAPDVPQGPMRGTGSGVLIDKAGYVVTNAHVVEHGDKVTVSFGNSKGVPAKVVGRDPMTDVAVVKVDKPPADAVAARLGDAQKLRIGEWVLAVGSPLGMSQTVTSGIISGLGHTGSGFQFTSGQRVRDYIQTDAKINPGNSGGPLVNLAGEVVGINTLINVGPGGSYGFAIPINQVREVASVLMKEGRMHYAYLGVMIGDVDNAPDELKRQLGKGITEGAVVTSVTPGGPAAAVGLKPGDVITKLGGQTIKSASDVVAFVSGQKIGSKVPLGYVREGKANSAEVTLKEMPTPGEPSESEHRVGLRLQTVTPSLAHALGIEGVTKGAVVTEVVPGSPADKSGIAAGDVILEVNRKPVTSAADASRALHEAKGSALLRVTSNRGARFVTLDLGVG
jgi:serine protease Do